MWSGDTETDALSVASRQFYPAPGFGLLLRFSLSFGRGGDRSLEQGGDDRLVRVTNLAWSALAPHELDGGKISIDEIVVAAGGYCIDVDHRPLARLGAREQ